jgi:glyoxylate/hydroxypyruvate reductase A
MGIGLFTPTWEPSLWLETFRREMPEMPIAAWPDIGDPGSVDYAVAWLPKPGSLQALPNLKVIFSLGAGVDAILRDDTLPQNIPIVRVVEPDLTYRMSEYVVMQVLMHQRQQWRIEENQRARKWDSFASPVASDFRVGVMGLGVLGQDAARKLSVMGFKVSGWSQTRKQVAGITSFAGAAELDAFLQGTDILVVLLPHTPQTHGILNRTLFAKLSRSGPLGAPVLINAGRGKLQNEADILACLDDGTLHGASLDVFEAEPLDGASALWAHRLVHVSPHSAADSDPVHITRYIAQQIRRAEAGNALENIVDRKRGY